VEEKGDLFLPPFPIPREEEEEEGHNEEERPVVVGSLSRFFTLQTLSEDD